MRLWQLRAGGVDLDSGGPPEWTRDAVAYQIFVDRFANGNPALDPPNVAPWGSTPTATGFMGGDLQGIAERLDYLADLGVTLVLLTPIFHSTANHRYNTHDYYRIDPRLGSLDDFTAFLAGAHRAGIRVLLDGVFNHCGRGCYPFLDVMENGADSACSDWFYIEGFPVDAYGAHRFKAWLDAPAVPEFNLANPEARAYVLRIAEFWTAQGIDGWRLDAVPHVRYRPFWGELRRAIKKVNPDAYLVAEIWDDASTWLDAGNFDGATNYPFRELVLQFVVHRAMPPSELARRLEELAARHAWQTTLRMCNLIGSHDTPRAWTLARGDVARVKMLCALQFAFPGIPALYYGDEIGLEGGAEPGNRGAMPWDEGCWNRELHAFVRRLAALRRSLRALQDGDWHTLLADDRSGVCGFSRRSGGDAVILTVHNGVRMEFVTFDLGVMNLPEACRFVDRLTGRVFPARQHRLQVGGLCPQSVALLTPLAAGDQA